MSDKNKGEAIEAALEQCLEHLYAPLPNCSCLISPPCNDCVEYAGIRDAIRNAKAALSQQPAQPTAIDSFAAMKTVTFNQLTHNILPIEMTEDMKMASDINSVYSAEEQYKFIIAVAPEYPADTIDLIAENLKFKERLLALDKELQSNYRMFMSACEDLGAISYALSIDSDIDGGADPILETIVELQISDAGWISCDERLPELNEFVLVSLNHKKVDSDFDVLIASYTRSYKGKLLVFVLDGREMKKSAITHWMSLPLAPTVDKTHSD